MMPFTSISSMWITPRAWLKTWRVPSPILYSTGGVHPLSQVDAQGGNVIHPGE